MEPLDNLTPNWLSEVFSQKYLCLMQLPLGVCLLLRLARVGHPAPTQQDWKQRRLSAAHARRNNTSMIKRL